MIVGLRDLLARLTEPTRVRARAAARRNQLSPVHSNGSVAPNDVVVVTVVKDDGPRLEYWLDYYRRLGADHFVVIDNGSSDGTVGMLRSVDDVTVYATTASFGKAHYGVDWVNGLLHRLRIRNWVLWVDSDEFLVFDGSADFGLHPLVDHLESLGLESLQCHLLDLYSRRPVRDNVAANGTDPLEVCRYYDAEGYVRRRYGRSRTRWIKGGVRGRLFFEDDLDRSPALNKTPLVRWTPRTRFVQVAHRLFPDALNTASEDAGITGVLLHQKFLASVAVKVADGSHVAEHDPEYRRYVEFGDASPWAESVSREFRTTGDLVENGLMTRIAWPSAADGSAASP